MSVLGGNRHWLLTGYDPTPFWDIRLLAAAPEGLDTFEIRVDMVTGETFAVDAEDTPLADEHVGKPYPNPAWSTASFPLVLNRASQVTLSVFDLLGRRVATLANRAMPAGRHEVQWNVSAVPSGVYIYTLVAAGMQESGRIVIAR